MDISTFCSQGLIRLLIKTPSKGLYYCTLCRESHSSLLPSVENLETNPTDGFPCRVNFLVCRVHHDVSFNVTEISFTLVLSSAKCPRSYESGQNVMSNKNGVERRKTLGHLRSINTNMTNYHQKHTEYQYKIYQALCLHNHLYAHCCERAVV